MAWSTDLCSQDPKDSDQGRACWPMLALHGQKSSWGWGPLPVLQECQWIWPCCFSDLHSYSRLISSHQVEKKFGKSEHKTVTSVIFSEPRDWLRTTDYRLACSLSSHCHPVSSLLYFCISFFSLWQPKSHLCPHSNLSVKVSALI